MKFWKGIRTLFLIGGIMLTLGCGSEWSEDQLCEDLCTAHVDCGLGTGYVLGRFCDDFDDRCTMDSCLIQCHQSLSDKGIGRHRLKDACTNPDCMLEAFACLYSEAALSCASLESIATAQGFCEAEVKTADEACINYRRSYLFW
jgi:hypothetical protein